MPGFELFGDLERKEINDVLQTGVLMRYGFEGARNNHWKSKSLEEAIEQTLSVQYAQLTSSGTAALSVAMAILEIGVGDEVIIPTFTFVASFEVVIAAGATPVLVEIDDTLGLDPEAVRQAITPKTKAVMVVHMCGTMVDLDPILAICTENKLRLIEDACQSFGGSYKNKKLGTIGDVGCFSFDYVKTITCGEGGAVITNNKQLYQLADQYTDHGHDHVGTDRGAENHPFIGYNFRISELHAAVGLAQISRLDHILKLQRRNNAILKNALSKLPHITFRRIPDIEGDSGGWLSFFLPTQKMSLEVVNSFKQTGIDAFWNYFDNNWHYIRKWDHLKNAKSMYPLSNHVHDTLHRLKNQQFTQSDDYISRNISCLIKLSWSENEVHEHADQMVRAIRAVL